MEELIAALKTYKTLLDFAHWLNNGYSDHLLYDRLRKDIDGITDTLVERYLGNNTLNFALYNEIINRPAEQDLSIEKEDILRIAKLIYAVTNDDDLRDLKDLMSIHIYLLKK